MHGRIFWSTKQSNGSADTKPARVVFTDETSVFLGGREVRAHYFGRGHTNGDAVIYFPDARGRFIRGI